MKRLAFFWLLIAAAIQAQSVAPKGAVDPLSTGQQYVLGPGDLIVIHAPNADELSEKPYRIDVNGTIDLPLVGRVHPGGQSVERFEAELLDKLNLYIKDPRVNITVTQYRSERVTFAGAFRSPGVYSLDGRHTLTEMLAIAGGLTPGASRVLTITRGGDHAVEASAVPPAKSLVMPGEQKIKVDVTPRNGKNPADDFTLEPFDLVTAYVGEPIYVTGEVVRVGGIDLEDRASMGVLQTLGLCGGLTKDASTRVKVYRPLPDSDKKREIDVDLEKVIKGQEKDAELLPRDVVFVPRSTSKMMSNRLATVALGILMAAGSGVAVMH